MIPELISSCFIVCVHSFRKRWSLGAFMRVIYHALRRRQMRHLSRIRRTALCVEVRSSRSCIMSFFAAFSGMRSKNSERLS